MTIRRLRVSLNESGQPLIDFLARHGGSSRKKAKSLLDRRLVFINGRRVWMARHALEAGDIIDMAEASPPPPAPAAAIVLFQDSDYLIADKPGGILANGPNSLESRLQTAWAMPSLVAVHRLDRGTSGCLLFAKHEEAQRRILPLFSGRKMIKIYHALAAGLVSGQRFSIAKPIDDQSALTDVLVLDANRQASHLQIVIHTGRTHQIRKHLTSIGHPIFGDPAYATRREISPLERSLQRPLLHAFRLRFIQPISGRPVQCTAPLPADFRQALALLHLR